METENDISKMFCWIGPILLGALGETLLELGISFSNTASFVCVWPQGAEVIAWFIPQAGSGVLVKPSDSSIVS